MHVFFFFVSRRRKRFISDGILDKISKFHELYSGGTEACRRPFGRENHSQRVFALYIGFTTCHFVPIVFLVMETRGLSILRESRHVPDRLCRLNGKSTRSRSTSRFAFTVHRCHIFARAFVIQRTGRFRLIWCRVHCTNRFYPPNQQ